MSPDDFRDRGIALRERVQEQVDAREGLERLYGTDRRRMWTGVLAGAVALVALVVVTATLVRTPTQPVGRTVVTTTTTEASPSTRLPVTVYVALLDEYRSEDGEADHCRGTGIHAGIERGASTTVFGAAADEGPRVISEATITEQGAIIDASRAQALGLPTSDAACLFEIATVTTDSDQMLSLALGATNWPPPGGFEAGTSQAGQQTVFYSRGMEP